VQGFFDALFLLATALLVIELSQLVPNKAKGRKIQMKKQSKC
jgi:hypothetical protein